MDRGSVRRGYFGVEGLDDLLQVGIPYNTQILVEGDTGVGKSMLAAQFLYEGLMVGDTCIYIACDEPPDATRENMANFRLGARAHERAGKLFFVDAFATERSTEKYFIPEPTNFDEFFLYEKRFVEQAGDGPKRLVVDSLSTLTATAEANDIVTFNANRLKYLRSRQVLTLDIVVTGTLEERAVNGLRHAYPLILHMNYAALDGTMQRYLRLSKMKSGQFTATQHPFTIDPRTGIVVQKERG